MLSSVSDTHKQCAFVCVCVCARATCYVHGCLRVQICLYVVCQMTSERVVVSWVTAWVTSMATEQVTSLWVTWQATLRVTGMIGGAVSGEW